jgi:hypothetical protein
MTNYRKIYEHYYGIRIPKGYHIHHKDMNHGNNDPLNLECLHKDVHAQRHGFLTNFLMAQASASELGARISSIKNLGNKHNLGRKHLIEQNKTHSEFMKGNQYRLGRTGYKMNSEQRLNLSLRQMGKRRGPYNKTRKH